MPRRLPPVDPEHDPASGSLRRPRLLVGLFLLIALLIGVDVLVDQLEGASPSHIVIEVVVVVAAFLGVSILARDLAAARARTESLARRLTASHRDADRYKEQVADLLRGLGDVIDQQMGEWGLTEAEREVAVLLLKGLSHKEVARARGTSERTARKQALAVYKKGGLDGRAGLSAFFLEDLLPSRASSPGAEKRGT